MIVFAAIQSLKASAIISTECWRRNREQQVKVSFTCFLMTFYWAFSHNGSASGSHILLTPSTLHTTSPVLCSFHRLLYPVVLSPSRKRIILYFSHKNSAGREALLGFNSAETLLGHALSYSTLLTKLFCLFCHLNLNRKLLGYISWSVPLWTVPVELLFHFIFHLMWSGQNWVPAMALSFATFHPVYYTTTWSLWTV